MIVMAKDIRSHIINPNLVYERRKHIVQCSAKLIMKQGFHNTTLRQISVACNMGMGTLYHYIGSKNDILRLVTDVPFYRLHEFGDELTKQMSAETNYDQILITAIDKYYRFVDEFQDVFLLNLSESKHLPKDIMITLFQENAYINNIFENILVKGEKAGFFKVDYPRLLARNITTLGSDWAYSRWAFRSEFSITDYIKQQTTIILHAIQK